ncbi:SDR family NAD(P)-dependent oxidoreductase [Mycobacterium kubicae]|uniref:SDR family NAD(P)-dependent oxidoreductase n=1 Tax=Mycobacterium kubicae TaxID=120959 RepID=UPI000801798E|nr:SDR family NAD(P)-dependent oxidoreductase [Mycobacterium kubicae]OBK54826.1 short-chain dehydrogenase [Mycobacterium kubicae]
MIDFTDQAIAVTGAGRGLGRLYALDLAKRGASVVVNDLGGSMGGEGADPTVADEVVGEITQGGGKAVASHDSVESPEGGEAIVQAAIKHFGRLDAVVSNAGIFNSIAFEEMTPDQWRQMLKVHLDGGFHLSQPAFKIMKNQGYGRFVFISSSGGMFGQHLEAHYGAAKAGLVGLSNVIALEGAEHGILSNTVLPFGFSRMVTETVDAKTLEETGLKDLIAPEKVVPMVTYLASRACEVTHQNYSALAGRYGRVFIGLGDGWLAEKDVTATADDIAEHFAQVSDTESYSIPDNIYEELFSVMGRLGIDMGGAGASADSS